MDRRKGKSVSDILDIYANPGRKIVIVVAEIVLTTAFGTHTHVSWWRQGVNLCSHTWSCLATKLTIFSLVAPEVKVLEASNFSK